MKKITTLKTKPKTSISETIREIRGRFGEDAIVKLNEKPNVDVDAISTGSIGIDSAIGIGGLPRGRVVEIFGPESSGKTTLALHVVAEAQKAGGVCAYIDAEHAMDPQYAKRLGVKTEDLFISQPTGGEEALQIVDVLVKGGNMSVVVVDSVASLVPRSELDGEIGELKIGAQARLMSQALRMLTSSVAKSNTLVIFINQIRTNIGQYSPGGMVPEMTSGGRALKYYSSVRIDVRKIASIKKGEDIMGSRIRAKIVKNKVAPPFKQTEFDILYNEGISRFGEIIALGESHQILLKSGSGVYEYKGEKLGRGYEATMTFLKDNEKIFNEIKNELLVKLNKNEI